MPDDRHAAAPCVAAFCADCLHAHAGRVCDQQVITEQIYGEDGDGRRVLLEQRHGPCGCEKYVREKPTRCAFNCKCDSPSCSCKEHCRRHANAILAHRAKPKHKLHKLALTAHHPGDA